MGIVKKLAGEAALYGISSIIGRVLNYFLVPLYTAVFVAAEYGVVTELYAYIAFLNIIYAYGLETAYFRFATGKKMPESKVYNLAVTSILFTTVCFSTMCLVLATRISLFLGYPEYSHIVAWIAGILAIDAIVAIPFARLRLHGRARYFVFVRLTNISVNIILNLFFIVLAPAALESGGLPSTLVKPVYNPDWGIEYIFLSNLIANFLMILLLWKSFRQWRITWSWPALKPMVVYAFPILFTGLAGVTNEMLSRTLLRHWLPEGFYGNQTNTAALGVFGACYKISVLMTLVVQAFRYAAEPFFFNHATDKNSPQLYAEVMHWFILFGSLFFLIISTNLDLLGFLFLRSAEYREGLYIVPYLLLGGLFLGIYYNLSVWYKLTNNTSYGAYMSTAGAVLTITFNILLIPQMGYLGSAITTTITYLGMVVMSYLLGKRKFPVPYLIRKDMTYILLAVMLVFMAQTIPANLTLSIVIRVVTVMVFILTILLLEKITLKNIFRSSRFP